MLVQMAGNPPVFPPPGVCASRDAVDCPGKTLAHMLAITAPLALLAACSVSKPYSGHSPATVEAQRVILDCNELCGFVRNVETGKEYDFRGVDQFVVVENVGEVTLDPGIYEVEVYHSGGIKIQDEIVYWPLPKFEALPGHTYLVHREYSAPLFGGDGWTYKWIVDRATGEIVTGDPPPDED